MKKINVGLIGFGNVGQGLVKLLRDRRRLLKEKTGLVINIRKICDKDLKRKRSVPVEKSILCENPRQVLADPQIDVIVELIGGIHPAKEIITEALERGKNVVTANKALLAEEGKELFALANRKGKNIYFEASVGAGIPIIKSLREGLVANKFSGIFGIVNGTSNYVLSCMSGNNMSFRDALRQAEIKGFAERNSRLDIEGIDSAHKLVLLVYLTFGRLICLEDVFIEGISNISLADVNYAKELGFEIKLLAIAKKEGSSLEVRVHPTLVPRQHLLSSVSGVFNAIYASSDLAGNLLFYGPGAGMFCAASAVAADLVDIARDLETGLFKTNLSVVLDESIKRLSKMDEFESRHYIRFMAIDKPGVLAKISGVLAKSGISIASVTQKERSRSSIVPIVMLTHECGEKRLRLALEEIDRLQVIREKSVTIRIEQL